MPKVEWITPIRRTLRLQAELFQVLAGASPDLLRWWQGLTSVVAGSEEI